MSRRLDTIVRALTNSGIPVQDITPSDDPDLEDHSIQITPDIHVQVSACEDFYVNATRESTDEYGETVFNMLPMRTNTTQLIADIKQMLKVTKQA